MNTIKFSHRYVKMPDDVTYTRILEVFIANKNDLYKGFVEYDTLIDTTAYEHYQLPPGKLIVLLLQSASKSSYSLWTTIRRWTQEKEKYYRGIRGQYVNIEVK